MFTIRATSCPYIILLSISVSVEDDYVWKVVEEAEKERSEEG